jgi:hypothetical protein
MELRSDPKQYDTIQVTDIDISFPGDLQTYTLRDGVDSYTVTPTEIILYLAAGTVRFNKTLAHWDAIRTRSMRVPVPAAQSGSPTTAPPPSNAG